MVQSASCATTTNNNIIFQNRTTLEKFAKLTGNSVGQSEKVMEKWIGKRPWNMETSAEFNSQVIEPLRNLRIALIVVDFQNDFVNGSLKIGDGDAGQDPLKAIDPLNNLITTPKWDMIVYTKDWHPANHISFLSQAHNSDRVFQKPVGKKNLSIFDSLQFETPIETEQIMYPDHCVQDSTGSEIYPDIQIMPNATYIFKGTYPFLDSYSAFFDNNGLSKTELEDVLKERKIDAVVIAGLAYDICVKYTCLDAIRLNFLSAVVPECSAGLMKNSIEEAEKEFRANDIAIITAQQAMNIAQGSFVPDEWVRKVARI